MLGDVEAQRAYLANAFAAAPPALTGILNLGERYDYIGVRVMAADESDDGSAIRMIGDLYQADKPLSGMTESEYAQVRWLDKRAVVEMHRDEAAPAAGSSTPSPWTPSYKWRTRRRRTSPKRWWSTSAPIAASLSSIRRCLPRIR